MSKARTTIQRILLFAASIALVAAIAYAFLPRRVVVEIQLVQTGTIQVTVDEDGKTRIKEKYVVSAPLPGRLRACSFMPVTRWRLGRLF